MQVSVENTSGLERRLTVQIPGQEIQDKITSKLREIGKTVRIKGFRPGRVPMTVVKQRYGQQARQEIQGEAIQAALQQAIQDEDLRLASMPRLDGEPVDTDDGNFEFIALVEVYPEIAELDVSSITLESPAAEVVDEDIDEMLSTLQDQRTTWDEVERKAEEGDQVMLEYSAETEDGRVPEEGATRMGIVMGKSDFAGLEKVVAKLDAGEEKSAKLTFPDDFRDPALAGKKAQTQVKLISVSEGTRPEVDETFIKSFGVDDGEIEAFRAEIRNNLERELKQARATLLKTNLIEELIKATPDLEVPASIVRQEAAGMAQQMMQQQGQKEVPPEVIQQLVEPFTPQAEKRVRAGLLLGELAQQNEIRIDPVKVREAIDAVAGTYEQPDEVVQLYYSNQQLMQQVESSVLEEQVVDWALENAKVDAKDMKFQEVITAATARAQG